MVGYEYRDGAYWRKSDGAGPFGFSPQGTPYLLNFFGQRQSAVSSLVFKDGAYWKTDGSGPITVG